MRRIQQILKLIKMLVKGRLQIAIDEGMTVESGVSVMGGSDFGSEPYLITLKQGCRISNEVMFITHDGGTWVIRNRDDKYKNVKKFGEIVVGKNSFIGARTIILPGVHIGDNCVVGAGSVVNRDIPDETVVAGVPAKKICSVYEYAEKALGNMPSGFDEREFEANKKKYLLKIFKECEE